MLSESDCVCAALRLSLALVPGAQGAACCSARSGTAMDLGLDYFRVLLALGFVSGWFCTPKSAWPVGPGVIGVSRQAFSGFYKRLWVTGLSRLTMP